jgi:hypothetical protein
VNQKVLLFAQVGASMLPVGAASSAQAVIKALQDAPDVETDDAQLQALDRKYQERIDRREAEQG